MPPTTTAADEEREPVLSPVDRVCELCFGLFMALTFVGAVSATTEAQTHWQMFYTALGCNLAWGLADGVMYLVRTLTARGRRIGLALAIRGGATPADGVRLLGDELTGVMRLLVSPAELEAIRARIATLPDVPSKPSLHARDYGAALAVFAFVVLGTFPVALPFLLFEHTPTALLVSRVLTIAMLFASGLALSRYAGAGAGGWKSGVAMTTVGVLLTAAIIALGG